MIWNINKGRIQAFSDEEKFQEHADVLTAVKWLLLDWYEESSYAHQLFAFISLQLCDETDDVMPGFLYI